MNIIRRDCVLYNAETKDCRGLKKLYCKRSVCQFFKSAEDYKIVKNGFVEEKEK